MCRHFLFCIKFSIFFTITTNINKHGNNKYKIHINVSTKKNNQTKNLPEKTCTYTDTHCRPVFFFSFFIIINF